MELHWNSRGRVMAIIGGREVPIAGEVMIAGDTHFLIYPEYVAAWADGTPLTEEEKVEILDDVVEEARRRGWKFRIDW